MSRTARCLVITSEAGARAEMDKVGVDPGGLSIMAPKQLFFNIKVDALTPAQANILKQEMLSLGGEAAVARGTAACSVASTGAVVSGTLRQVRGLVEKLKLQPLGLKAVSASIDAVVLNYRRDSFEIRCAGKTFHAGKRTLVAGILNVTPDSFSDGGRFSSVDSAIKEASGMIEAGADWIDVGGESTRPGAAPVDKDEEIRRVVPVIEALSKKDIPVSIDTMKAPVARAAIESGAGIINDVSALGDARMASVASSYGCPVILMHMRGTPETMQKDTGYFDLMGEVYAWLAARIEYATSNGIDIENIIIDPGAGFGKSLDGNLEILRRLGEFKSLGRPILAGLSRKSFIGKATGTADPLDRLPGTIAANAIAVLNGASIIRVHDVKEGVAAARMADAVRGQFL